MKAVGYIRVSSAVQVEGESLDTQRKQIKDFCTQKGWDLVQTYADEGKTGAKLAGRMDFAKMLEEAKKKKFDVIVIWKLSRFARNARDFQNIMYDLEKQGVTIASVKEGIDPTTKTGKMIAGMLSLFAEWEHETIREQMWENKMAVWQDHRAFMGKTPFGYTWNKETKKLEIIPEEAKIYRQIIDMYIKQGMSMKDIVIRLNDQGFTTMMYRKKVNGKIHIQKPFSSSVISYILKNPVYYGFYQVNKYKYEDGAQGAGTKRTKNLKKESEMITFPVEPLISKREWDRIQETTEFRKVKTKNKGEFTDYFFLRDICTCGQCGSKLGTTIANRRKDGTRPRYYSCYWAHTSKKSMADGRREKCSQPYVPAEELEKQVWNSIMAKFGIMGKGKEAFNQLHNIEKSNKELNSKKESLDRLKNDLEGKERAKNRIYSLLEDEGIDTEDMRSKLRENQNQIVTIKGNIAEIEKEVDELEKLLNDQKLLSEIATNNKDHYKKFRQELRDLSLTDKKLLMEAWIDGSVKVDYNRNGGEDGGLSFDFKTRIGLGIIERFIEEGKISRLNKNSAFDHHPDDH